MSQVSDVSLANQGFSAFRTELNNILGALNTSHIGSSAPASLAAGSIWVDTSGGATAYVLKFYDGSDHIALGTINTTANSVDWTDSSVTFDIVNDTSPQLGGDLDTNSQNIKIDDAHGLFDENNNEQLILQTTASAVNFVELTNSATSNNPSISANGSDTNVGLSFSTKGTGAIKFNDLAYVPQQALTSSSNAVAWDVQAKPNAYHLTTENTTFSAPTNAVEGAFICLEINFDGTHTIGWNTVFEFAASTEPTETATNGKTDIHVFRYNGAIWQEVGRTMNLSES
ncbi:MAG: hypothetical protein HN564_03470 [Flavobacteriales bacterium]|jgi:hypothetical protein|nr:hypothetical protein [Flavobacteriales bacterium]